MNNYRPEPIPVRVAERGVYEHPFVGPRGERYLFAVDRHGRRILEATLYRWVSDPSAVTEVLQSFLDQEDPDYLKLLS